jgi:hypothetical protein
LIGDNASARWLDAADNIKAAVARTPRQRTSLRLETLVFIMRESSRECDHAMARTRHVCPVYFVGLGSLPTLTLEKAI